MASFCRASMKVLTIAFTIAVVALQLTAQSRELHKAPPLTLKDLSGKPVALADLKGTVVLLNFWATWCPPCAAEMPDLERWHKEYESRGLRVVGITSPPTNMGETRVFVERMGIGYAVWLGTQATKRLFSPGGKIPISVIIDRQGNIVRRIDGIFTQSEFDKRLVPLLDPPKN